MTLRPLRSGYTTGACAAAAARGAALMLRHQHSVSEVTITLPNGDTAVFHLSDQQYTRQQASCCVIKDAGDDPDVTNGAAVYAAVRCVDSGKPGITIEGGAGIGHVTKPGLAIPPGDWAINPVPRRMISTAVAEVFPRLACTVTISIPDGAERAKRTLNERLGIIGGLSVLGTTGIVRPLSAGAWTDTIDSSLDVARACGCRTVVLSTGRTSEQAAQKMFDANCHCPPVVDVNHEHLTSHNEQLPEEAYIMMGDHIAHSVRSCLRKGFDRPLVACQFAKLLKIACGHANTHAAASDLDLAMLLQWSREGDLPQQLLDLILQANTAREIVVAASFDPALLRLVTERARSAITGHAPGIAPEFLIVDYNGTVIPAIDPSA